MSLIPNQAAIVAAIINGTQMKPAKQINIGDVVREMENHFHIVDCFNAKKAGLCRLHPHCGLTAVLTNALEQFFLVLDATTLSDILPNDHDEAVINPDNESAQWGG